MFLFFFCVCSQSVFQICDFYFFFFARVILNSPPQKNQIKKKVLDETVELAKSPDYGFNLKKTVRIDDADVKKKDSLNFCFFRY